MKSKCCCSQLCTLLRRDFRSIRSVSLSHLCLQVFVPALMIMLLALSRILSVEPPGKGETNSRQDIYTDARERGELITIGYTPETVWTKDIVKRMQDRLKKCLQHRGAGFHFVGYSSDHDMLSDYMKGYNNKTDSERSERNSPIGDMHAGIEFRHAANLTNKFTNRAINADYNGKDDLEIVLKLRGRYGIYDPWHLNEMYPPVPTAACDRFALEGYRTDGVNILLLLITEAIVNKNNRKAPHIRVLTTELPCRQWKNIRFLLPVVVVVAYLPGSADLTSRIQRRRIRNSTAVMRLNGLKEWLLFFINIFLVITHAFALAGLFLLAFIHDDERYLLRSEDALGLFTLFTLYGLASNGLAFAVSSFANITAKSTTTLVVVITLLQAFPAIYALYGVPPIVRTVLSCIFPSLALDLTIERMMDTRENAKRFEWPDVYRPRDRGRPSKMIPLAMLALQSVIFFVMTLIGFGHKKLCCGRKTGPDNRNTNRKKKSTLTSLYPYVELLDINMRSRGRNQHDMNNITFDIKPGEKMCVLGASGAGKTALVKIITGQIRRYAGLALIDGESPPSFLKTNPRSIGLCPQHIYISDKLTVKETLHFHRKLGCQTKDIVETLSTKFNLDINMHNSQLTCVAARRVQLAIAYLNKPKFIVLDEPTDGMDAHSVINTENTIKKQSGTVMICTSNATSALRLADRVVLISNGTVIYVGTPTEVKDAFGAGYLLTIGLHKYCNIENLTNYIRLFEPRLYIISVSSSTLTCMLPDSATSKFEFFLANLDWKQKKLKIYAFGIQHVSMDNLMKWLPNPRYLQARLDQIEHNKELMDEFSLDYFLQRLTNKEGPVLIYSAIRRSRSFDDVAQLHRELSFQSCINDDALRISRDQGELRRMYINNNNSSCFLFPCSCRLNDRIHLEHTKRVHLIGTNQVANDYRIHRLSTVEDVDYSIAVLTGSDFIFHHICAICSTIYDCIFKLQHILSTPDLFTLFTSPWDENRKQRYKELIFGRHLLYLCYRSFNNVSDIAEIKDTDDYMSLDNISDLDVWSDDRCYMIDPLYLYPIDIDCNIATTLSKYTHNTISCNMHQLKCTRQLNSNRQNAKPCDVLKGCSDALLDRENVKPCDVLKDGSGVLLDRENVKPCDVLKGCSDALLDIEYFGFMLKHVSVYFNLSFTLSQQLLSSFYNIVRQPLLASCISFDDILFGRLCLPSMTPVSNCVFIQLYFIFKQLEVGLHVKFKRKWKLVNVTVGLGQTNEHFKSFKNCGTYFYFYNGFCEELRRLAELEYENLVFELKDKKYFCVKDSNVSRLRNRLHFDIVFWNHYWQSNTPVSRMRWRHSCLRYLKPCTDNMDQNQSANPNPEIALERATFAIAETKNSRSHSTSHSLVAAAWQAVMQVASNVTKSFTLKKETVDNPTPPENVRQSSTDVESCGTRPSIKVPVYKEQWPSSLAGQALVDFDMYLNKMQRSSTSSFASVGLTEFQTTVYPEMSGFGRLWKKLVMLQGKVFLCTVRSPSCFLLQLIVPVAIISTCLSWRYQRPLPIDGNLPLQPCQFSSYRTSVVPYEASPIDDFTLLGSAKATLIECQDAGNGHFLYRLSVRSNMPYSYRDMCRKDIEAEIVYDKKAYHSEPFGIAALMSAYHRCYHTSGSDKAAAQRRPNGRVCYRNISTEPQPTLSFSLEPWLNVINFSDPCRLVVTKDESLECVVNSVLLTLVLNFMTACFVWNLINERESGFYFLQHLCGGIHLLHIFPMLVMHLGIFTLCTSVMLIPLVFCQCSIFNRPWLVVGTLVLYANAKLPLIYSVHRLFSKPHKAVFVIWLISSFVGIIQLWNSPGLTAEVPIWDSNNGPNYPLHGPLYLLTIHLPVPSACATSLFYGLCIEGIHCSGNIESNIEAWFHKHFILLTLHAVVWYVVWMICQAHDALPFQYIIKTFSEMWYEKMRKKKGKSIHVKSRNSKADSMNASSRYSSSRSSLSESERNVSVIFKDVQITPIQDDNDEDQQKGINLTIEPGSIVGITGGDASTRSQILEMLVGVQRPTIGDVVVNSKTTLILDVVGMTKYGVSYCPAKGGLLGCLTARETLTLLGQLRGVRHKEVRRDIAILLDLMGLTANADTYCSNLSDVDLTKTRLCTALIGNPSIIVLDEPTNGLTFLELSNLGQILVKHRRSGGVVFLASEEAEVCEALCTEVYCFRKNSLVKVYRVSFGIDPAMEGSRYCTGFLVNVMMKKNDDGTVVNPSPEDFFTIIHEKIAAVEIYYDDQGSAQFHFAGRDVNLARVFTLMEDGIQYYGVSEYTVSRPGLEYIVGNAFANQEVTLPVFPGIKRRNTRGLEKRSSESRVSLSTLIY